MSATYSASINQLLPLFRELNALKQIRAPFLGSVAEQIFSRSWRRLIVGEESEFVARNATAHAVAAAKLGAINAEVLEDGGLNATQRLEILQRSFDASSQSIDASERARLRAALSPETKDEDAILHLTPAFVTLLEDQPFAASNFAPSYAEHCALVAVQSVLVAPLFGAKIGNVFLTGLTHHLHNAYLPNADEHLLGEHLQPLQQRFRERGIEELSDALRQQVVASLNSISRADTPEAKAFQVGDALDHILEVEWHAQQANFSLETALEETHEIRPEPVQSFHLELMQTLGFKQ